MFEAQSMGRNALHFAADYGQTEILSYLLDNGGVAFINQADHLGITPLMNAVYEGHSNCVKVS